MTTLTLILDTSLHVAQAALYDRAGAVVQHVSQKGERGQTDVLLPVLRELMQGRAYAQLSDIIVTVGPGVFTGIRAGIAAARALRLALDIPLRGVTTLDVLLAQTGARYAIMDAHKNEAYVQAPEQSPVLIPCDGLAAFLKQANTIAVYPAAFTQSDLLSFDLSQTLHTISQLEPAAIFAAARRSPQEPMPLYVRAPDALPQVGKTLARKVSCRP